MTNIFMEGEWAVRRMTPSGSCEWSKRPTSPSLLDPIPETSQPNELAKVAGCTP
jgi:hypothetical protein